MNFSVSNCTVSKNGGFVVTLKTNGEQRVVDTPLGPHPTSGELETFYIKVLNTVAISTEVDLNLDDYKVVVHPFTTEDGKDLELKWLHHK